MLGLLIAIQSVVYAETLNLVYDANGNLITGDGRFRVYNSFNQLSAIYNGSTNISSQLLEEYTYHPLEERILYKKAYNTGGILNQTVYYISQNFVKVVLANGTVLNYTYVYHEGQLVAQLNPDGSKIFILGNLEGSSSVITNSTGQVIENTTYSPYGEQLSGGTKTRFNYEAKEYSSLVGDTDFHFRKYKPEWGMFTQPDTLISNVYDPQALNRYMFERGDPLGKNDKTGHIYCTPYFCIPEILTFVKTVTIVAGIFTLGYIALHATSNANEVQNSYDYYYEYASRADAYRKIIEETEKDIEEAENIKNILDMTRDDVRDSNFVPTPEPPLQFSISEKIIYPSPSATEFLFENYYANFQITAHRINLASSNKQSRSDKHHKTYIFHNKKGETIGGMIGNNVAMSPGFAKKLEEAMKDPKYNSYFK